MATIAVLVVFLKLAMVGVPLNCSMCELQFPGVSVDFLNIRKDHCPVHGTWCGELESHPSVSVCVCVRVCAGCSVAGFKFSKS